MNMQENTRASSPQQSAAKSAQNSASSDALTKRHLQARVVTMDGSDASEEKRDSMLSMLPQLFEFNGFGLTSVEVVRWPLIRLLLATEDDKNALERQGEVIIMGYKLVLLSSKRRFLGFVATGASTYESLRHKLQANSALAIEHIHERTQGLIVECRTRRTLAELMQEFENFDITEKALQSRKLTFPITASEFKSRDGEEVLKRLLNLLQQQEIVGLETRVLSPEESKLKDSTIVEVNMLEDDIHVVDRIAHLRDGSLERLPAVSDSAGPVATEKPAATMQPLPGVHHPGNSEAAPVEASLVSPSKNIASSGATSVDSVATMFDDQLVRARQSRNAYLLWDIENCSLQRLDDAVQVLHNMEAVMQHVAGYGWTPHNTNMALSRFVFINRASSNSYHVTSAQIKDLEDYQCTFVNYSSKGSADFALINEVDRIIRQNRSNEVLPIVCLVTGDRDFSSTLEKLHAEGYHDTILLHKDVARTSFLQHAGFALKWTTVRTLHSLNSKLTELPVPAHFHDFAKSQLRVAPSFALDSLVTTQFRDQSLAPEAYGYQSLVDVFSKLGDLGWVVNDADGLKFVKTVQNRVIIKRHSYSRYLLQYEVPRLAVRTGDGETRATTDVDIVQESRVSGTSSVHALVVSSCSIARAERTCDVLRDMLTQLSQHSTTVVVPGWTKHFGDAFVSSRVLSNCEQEAGVALVVHFKNGDNSSQSGEWTSAVTVEIASVDTSRVVNAGRMLRQLRPVVRVLNISDADFKVVNVTLTQELHANFGVKLHQAKNQRVEMYGFEPFVDAAMGQLTEFLNSLSVEFPFALPKKMSWLYILQFQAAFHAYLLDQHNVELISRKKGESGGPDDARSDDGMPRTGGTMFLKGTREQVEAASAFLTVITSELTIKHLEFKNCTSFKYKTLLNHQKHLHAQFSEGTHSTRDIANMVMDPTSPQSPPLLFISVSPPMHKQGFQHMEFPVDMRVEIWCHLNHRSSLEDVANSFRRVDANFTHVEEHFPGDFSPILKNLMDKAWRTALIEDTKISGVLWDQHRQIVTLWAEDRDAVQQATGRLRDLCIRAEDAEAHVVLRWPDSVLRYVLLAERNRQGLANEVGSLKEQEQVHIEMPYRDKKDPMACLLVSGNNQRVHDVQVKLTDTLRSLMEALRRVFVVISPPQYDMLTADGFRLVKSVQRIHGVYVNLQPPSDTKMLKPRETLGCIDMRIARAGEVKTDENLVYCTATIEPRGSVSRTLRVLCQDLSEASADAIVIPNDSKLRTTTNVAKAVLMSAAGLDPNTLQSTELFHNMACMSQIRETSSGGDIEVGSTFVTSGTQLKYAAHLLHVIVPNQNSNQRALLSAVHDCLKAVLQHATELGLQSIALPLFKLYGPTTDQHIIPLTIMTVMKYLTENPGSTIRRVDIISIFPDSCKEIQAHLERLSQQESTWHVEQDDGTFITVGQIASTQIEYLYTQHALTPPQHADVCIGSIACEDAMDRNIIVTTLGVYQENPESNRRRRLCRGGLASFSVFPQLMGPTMIPHFDVQVRRKHIDSEYELQPLDVLLERKPENFPVIMLEGFENTLRDAVLAIARSIRDEAMTTIWLPVLTDAPTNAIVEGLRPTARLLDVQLEARYRRSDATQPLTQSYDTHVPTAPVAADMGILVIGLRGHERDIARDLRMKVVEEATKWKKNATLPPEEWCNSILAEIAQVRAGVAQLEPPKTQTAQQVRQYLELVPYPDRVRSSPEELLLSVIHSWTNADSEPSFDVVAVDPASEEFLKVMTKVGLQNMTSTYDDVQLHRIMNMKLWSAYANKRLFILQQPHNRGKAELSDRLLLHGTSDVDPDVISANGFDFRFSKGRGYWGRGMYFSSDLEYVKTYAHLKPGSKGSQRQVLIANVCLGRSALLDKDKNLVKPPAGYDSVTGQTGSSPIFVTYDLDRAYPAYMLTFSERRMPSLHASARDAK